MKSLATTLLASFGAQAFQLPLGNLPSYQTPAHAWQSVEDANAARCKEAQTQANARSSKPGINRSPATPEGAPMERAVAHTVDGCPVPVYVGKSGPVPAPSPAKPPK